MGDVKCSIIYRWHVQMNLLCNCTHLWKTHDIISLRGEVWAHTTSLFQLCFIEMPVPSKDSERSCICVMVSVLASSAVDREFEPRSSQTKDYIICICCFSTRHTVLREDWLALNQVDEWSDPLIVVSVNYHYKTQLSLLV